jgi:hypothetical protein
MKSYAFLPITFLKFWYVDSPRSLVRFFLSVNRAFLQLFSLPLFIKTYTKPLKNEYRQGLVRFSKAMGVVIKSVLIVVDVLLFGILLFSEVVIFAGFLAFPVLTVLLVIW